MKHKLWIVAILACLPMLAHAQARETQVSAKKLTISGFPPDTAQAKAFEIFSQHNAEITAFAKELKENPNIKAVITGFADALPYRQSHDAKNTAIALARAEALQAYLLEYHGIPRERSSTEVRINEGVVGAAYRMVTLHFVAFAVPQPALPPTQPPAPPRVDTVVSIVRTSNAAHIGLHVGAGLRSTAFGILPILTPAVSYKQRFSIEAQFGYQLADDTWDTFSTRGRTASGHLAWNIFGHTNAPWLALVAGYVRTERVNTATGMRLEKREGPEFGLRGTIPLSAYWNVIAQANWMFGTYDRYAQENVTTTNDVRVLALITYNFGGSN